MPRARLQFLLEVLAALLLLVMLVLPVWYWTQLPDKLPTHFNYRGEPTAWGSKSSIWILPCLSIPLYALLTAAARYTKLASVPFTIDRDDPNVDALLKEMVLVVKAGVMLTFAFILWSSIRTALAQAGGLSLLFVPLNLLLVVGPALGYTVALWKYRIR